MNDKILLKEHKDALKRELIARLDDEINALGYSKVSSGLYNQNTPAGCKFIKIKQVPRSSTWPTFWIVFGYNNQEVTKLYQELKGGTKIYDKKPMLASWIGHVIQRNFSFTERQDMKAKYNCFPIGEWDIRSENELRKSDRIVDAIKAFESFFFSQDFSLEYHAKFPEKILDENHKDFLLLQIIAASKLKQHARKAKLIRYYEKRKNFDSEWVKKLRNLDSP